jgi:hypothetical protein
VIQSEPGKYQLSDLHESLVSSNPWSHDVSRGYGKTTNWDGKYLYGAFSSLIASYVIGIEFHDRLKTVNEWQDNPAAADKVIGDMWARYSSVSPEEVAEIVRLSDANELGEIFRSRMNAVATAKDNLDFMENVMANYLGSEASGIDTSRMDEHVRDGEKRRTLEPVSERWLNPQAASFEAELHRGGYANAFGIPPNSILAHLAGYFAGDRAFETDILNTKDLVAIVAHDFALNRLRGEFFPPLAMIGNLPTAEVGETHYGIVDPDLPFPNARKTEFNIKTLQNLTAFFDRYLPEASLSLDARNMSSVTAVIELNEHYLASRNETQKTSSTPTSAPTRPLATSVKLYPFLLAHGYDQALMEYVARTRENAGVGPEELKFWLPRDYDLEKVVQDYRTSFERRVAELGSGSFDQPRDAEDRAAIDRVAAMAPPTDQEREAFKSALQHSPLVLSAGGVLAGGPKPGSATAAKGIDTQFTKYDLELAIAHQGSNSVFAASNLTLEDKAELWKSKLPFGGTKEPSLLEDEITQSHGVPGFNAVEQQYIHFNTLKLFQWIASFVPHMHPQSSIQFDARPSLTEILKEIRSVNLLRDNAEELGLDKSHLTLNNLAQSSINSRLTLMDAAVVDNVRELIRLVGEGEVPVETYSNGSQGGNQEAVRNAFKQMTYAAFDRHSDFTLESEKLGETGKPKLTDWVYFVVQGRIDKQKKGNANQTGQLRHTPYWPSRSTTDLPVEFKNIYHYLALHRVGENSLPYPDHITNSRRSVLVRPYSEQEPQPRGVTWGSWQGTMPSKEQREAQLKDVLAERGFDALGPYMQEPGQDERSAQKRSVVVEKVRKARMR